jgi:hypothetical protein
MPVRDAIVGEFRLVIEVGAIPQLPGGDTFEAALRSITRYVNGEPRATVPVRDFRVQWGRTEDDALQRLLEDFRQRQPLHS